MSRKLITEFLAPDELIRVDEDEIERFNQRVREPYLLHPELGPSAFEGDPDTAPVVLLLANPGFDSTSTSEDHRFARPGWPLGGLHPEAPPGLRAWWTNRLRPLIEIIGAQATSQRVACLQICPWASRQFADEPVLPSRALTLNAANQCADRGAVLIIMRAERMWLKADGVRNSPRRYRVNSWRSAYVSPGNLSEPGWQAVLSAVNGAT